MDVPLRENPQFEVGRESLMGEGFHARRSGSVLLGDELDWKLGQPLAAGEKYVHDSNWYFLAVRLGESWDLRSLSACVPDSEAGDGRSAG